MNEFKPGDRVIIVGNQYAPRHYFPVGEEVTIETKGSVESYVVRRDPENVGPDDHSTQYINERDLKLAVPYTLEELKEVYRSLGAEPPTEFVDDHHALFAGMVTGALMNANTDLWKAATITPVKRGADYTNRVRVAFPSGKTYELTIEPVEEP